MCLQSPPLQMALIGQSELPAAQPSMQRLRPVAGFVTQRWPSGHSELSVHAFLQMPGTWSEVPGSRKQNLLAEQSASDRQLSARTHVEWRQV